MIDRSGFLDAITEIYIKTPKPPEPIYDPQKEIKDFIRKAERDIRKKP